MNKNGKPNYNEIIFSNEEEEQIIDLYINQKMSTVKIGKYFNVSHKTIAKVLERHNIPRTGIGKRKYELNEHYFDEIDTPNKAYILGFFFADGCNFPSKSTISMSLEEHDKEILEKIRLEINSERPLEFIEQSARHDQTNNYQYKDMWRLLIFSKHMCRVLNSYGMVPSKSLILEFPKYLDQGLMSHFIRGYFDGDGSYCCYIGKSGRRDLVTITSTNDFCEKCLDIIRRETGVGGGIYDASSHNGITKVISISGKNQLKKFFEWLYKDAELYMKRKHDLYIKHLAS